jgi:hypothetical protein
MKAAITDTTMKRHQLFLQQAGAHCAQRRDLVGPVVADQLEPAVQRGLEGARVPGATLIRMVRTRDLPACGSKRVITKFTGVHQRPLVAEVLDQADHAVGAHGFLVLRR